MKTDWNELIHRYITGQTSNEETRHLEASLKADDELADLYLRHIGLEVALETQASSAQITRELLSAPAEPVTRRGTNWYSWRPLTAAAAGIVFGMLCTSMVFGYVAQRMGFQKTSLRVFNASFEEEKHLLEDGLPNQIGQWGMDAAQVVSAEVSVTPLQGEHMLRLEPIPKEKQVKNHTSRAYQLLDLRSLLSFHGETEVEVTASFCTTNSDLSSRYLIRAIALDEAPETATKNFWPKVESDGVVSESQRFDTPPGKSGWHTFSMKLRLPPGSKTLVLIFGAVPPEDTSRPAFVHYLDDVQVSLLTPQPIP